MQVLSPAKVGNQIRLPFVNVGGFAFLIVMMNRL